jgi:hypothetical protein
LANSVASTTHLDSREVGGQPAAADVHTAGAPVDEEPTVAGFIRGDKVRVVNDPTARVGNGNGGRRLVLSRLLFLSHWSRCFDAVRRLCTLWGLSSASHLEEFNKKRGDATNLRLEFVPPRTSCETKFSVAIKNSTKKRRRRWRLSELQHQREQRARR